MDRTAPAYKPEFQARFAELNKTQLTSDPALRCANPGLPRIGWPAKIVQSDKQFIFLYDDLNGSFWRIVPLDKPHRADVDPSRLGDAVGRWEGDTLVVETVRFDDSSWLTGLSHRPAEGHRALPQARRGQGRVCGEG